MAILRRPVARYGSKIVIVHGDETGVEASFAIAAMGLRVKTESHPAVLEDLGVDAEALRIRAMFRAGLVSGW